jgi:hypothetical protein
VRNRKFPALRAEEVAEAVVYAAPMTIAAPTWVSFDRAVPRRTEK